MDFYNINIFKNRMNYPNLQKMQFTTITKKRDPLQMVNTQKTQVKKIVMVYQLQYTNGGIYGFGDFIRGCFCLIGICKKLNLGFDIDLSNHPLSKYLEGHIKNPTINYDSISKMEISYNTTEIMGKSPELFYININNLLQNINSEVYYTSTNSFPIFKFNQSDIAFIKSKLIPTIEMQKEIDQEMTHLNLINNDFSVIHIRAGDVFLFNENNVLNQDLVYKIFNYLRLLLNNKSRKYLILSDSTKLKMLFKPYENCVFQIKQITHLGEQLVLEDESVRNTMMDFYLMSRANRIYSYSMLSHGSGFSKWCAVVYNIPYESYII